jgi:hypothetical protein
MALLIINCIFALFGRVLTTFVIFAVVFMAVALYAETYCDWKKEHNI